MGSITQYGTLNLTALDRPDLYVQIVPPSVILLNGVPTNLGGIVGTASWGPVNSPVVFSGVQDGSQAFGSPVNRLYDLMSQATVAGMQGPAGNYVGVRVTDGTDTKASGTIGDNGYLAFYQALASAVNTGVGTPRGPSNIITAVGNANGLALTAKCSGSLGAKVNVSLTTGAKTGSYRLVVGLPGSVPEIFDNLGADQAAAAIPATGYITFAANPTANDTVTIGGTAVTFKASGAVGNQVNIGASLAATLTALVAVLAGSADTNLVKFTYGATATRLNLTAVTGGTAGNALTIAATVATPSGATLSGGAASMTAPTLSAIFLTGGTDGVAAIATANFVGTDTSPRTGMYALRKTGVSAAILADVSDATSWAAQVAFGISEGVLMGINGPSGDTIANAVTAKSTGGIDSPWAKMLFGDWVNWLDTYNSGALRTMSPGGFWLGRRVNLSPEQSALNKPILGIVSTQKSAASQVYADSDISQLYKAGYDVITNPVPGGSYFACRTGRNSSSAAGTHGENYTTITDYVASTINAGMGVFIGQLQSRRKDDKTRANAKATLDAFLGNLQAPGGSRDLAMIDDFQVTLDKTNNSDTSIGLGYMFAYVKVVYLSVIEFFVVNIEGGQTVVITRANDSQRQQFLLAA